MDKHYKLIPFGQIYQWHCLDKGKVWRTDPEGVHGYSIYYDCLKYATRFCDGKTDIERLIAINETLEEAQREAELHYIRINTGNFVEVEE